MAKNEKTRRGYTLAMPLPERTWLVYDSKDDRLEIWSLLHRLSPRKRIAFLKYAASRVKPNAAGHLPVPMTWSMRTTYEQAYRCDRADQRLTNEVFCDLLQLGNAWGLDLATTLNDLVLWVRRPEAYPAPSPPASAPRPPALRPASLSLSSSRV
jgi:hypothetical protein